jgi:hypothetical protein
MRCPSRNGERKDPWTRDVTGQEASAVGKPCEEIFGGLFAQRGGFSGGQKLEVNAMRVRVGQVLAVRRDRIAGNWQVIGTGCDLSLL